jgi:hypothetical protein
MTTVVFAAVADLVRLLMLMVIFPCSLHPVSRLKSTSRCSATIPRLKDISAFFKMIGIVVMAVQQTSAQDNLKDAGKSQPRSNSKLN